MPSFLKHVKVTYDSSNYPSDTNAHISRTFKDILAIDPTTKNASDGVVAGSPTDTFTSASVEFAASDVGKYLYIKTGANKGTYIITIFNSITSVDVNRNFPGNGTAIPFIISTTGNLYPYYHYVTYNGQEIPNRVDETSSTFSKFYYELDATVAGEAKFDVYANTGFADPNYSWGIQTPAPQYFSSTDVFTVNYLIEI